MHHSRQDQPIKLEALPNIGKSIAADLRAIGILHPQHLADREPLAVYFELATVMGQRHDPCVLYVLLAVKHFLEKCETLPWWLFTGQGKKLLSSR